MFDSEKSCTVVGFIIDIVYLVAMFFLVKLARDEAILIVACIVVAAVAATFGGKCIRTLFADGGFLYKVAGGIIAGLFAVGTIVVVYLGIVF